VTPYSRLLRLFVMSVLLASAAELATNTACAADIAGGTAAPPSKEVAILKEIVVTAQLRRQLLQEVPISAQVVSGDKLAQQNFNSLTSLSETVPSLHVEPVGRSTDIG
jgi:iron complex outermembrane receptor protein